MPARDTLLLPYPTTDLLSRKWVLPIISTLKRRIMRRHALERSLPGVTQKMLTETLRELERNGILGRRVYPTVPPRVEYYLTPVGLDLLKFSDIVSEWIMTHRETIVRARKSYDRRTK